MVTQSPPKMILPVNTLDVLQQSPSLRDKSDLAFKTAYTIAMDVQKRLSPKMQAAGQTLDSPKIPSKMKENNLKSNFKYAYRPVDMPFTSQTALMSSSLRSGLNENQNVAKTIKEQVEQTHWNLK
jgi:hypothetical protein